MAATKTKLTDDWQLVVADGVSFTLQVFSGNADVTFESSLPAATDDGFRLTIKQGVTQDYGSGNCYVRGHGFVVVMT